MDQPPAYPPPGYPQPPASQPYGTPYPYPAQSHMHQSHSTVVVAAPAAPQNNLIIMERQGVNHVLHFIITLFFWPWIIVWIILCIIDQNN